MEWKYAQAARCKLSDVLSGMTAIINHAEVKSEGNVFNMFFSFKLLPICRTGSLVTGHKA
jgi:hypothetical protein